MADLEVSNLCLVGVLDCYLLRATSSTPSRSCILIFLVIFLFSIPSLLFFHVNFGFDLSHKLERCHRPINIARI